MEPVVELIQKLRHLAEFGATVPEERFVLSGVLAVPVAVLHNSLQPEWALNFWKNR
jgi:hypothetical protein